MKKQLPTAIISVEYEELKTETYNGISVIDYDAQKIIYSLNTGNFLEDRDMINLIVEHNVHYTFYNSRSMNNFMIDLPQENQKAKKQDV